MTPSFQRLYPALTITLLSVGILLRALGYLGSGSLWFDEAMLALNVVEKSFLELLGPLEFQQIAPPLFLVLAKSASIVFGENEFALRSIPLLTSILSLVVFYLLLRRAFDSKLVIVPLGLFAFAEPLLLYSTEFKQYSTDVLVCVTMAFVSLRLIDSKFDNRRHLYSAIVIGCVSIFFSHTAILVLGACGVAIALAAINQSSKPVWVQVAIIGTAWIATFSLNYFLFLRGFGEGEEIQNYWSHAFLPPLTSFEAAKIWYDRLSSIYAYNGISGSAFYLFAFLGLSSLATLSRPNSFLARFGIALLLFSAIVSTLNIYPVSARLSLYLTPAIILITISGLKVISDRLGTIIGVALSIAVLSTSIHAGVTRFSRGFQVEELHPLLETLNSKATEGDHLYIYYGAIPAFRFYNRSLDIDPSNFRFGSTARKNREQYLLDIENMKSHGRVWFVFSHVFSWQSSKIS